MSTRIVNFSYEDPHMEMYVLAGLPDEEKIILENFICALRGVKIIRRAWKTDEPGIPVFLWFDPRPHSQK